MPLTNLHSYHYRQLFQSATALPRQWYDRLNNRYCLLPAYRHTRQHQPAHTISLSEALYPENFRPSPPPTRRPPVTLEGRSWHTATTTPPAAPGTETPAVQPPPSTRAATAKTPPARKKVVWRKGHGLIERVDKLSGEIFHLVEIET